MLTEVDDRGRKLYSWTGVALQTVKGSSLACYPSPPSKSQKNNFDEAQKLMWKEIRCLNGLKTMITSNRISELLKMQLESKRQIVHTQGTPSGFISKHAVATQKSISIRGSYIGKPRIRVRLHLVYSNHYSTIVLVLGSSSAYSQHIIAAKMV